MLSEVRPVDWNDRRFCFEIYTSQHSQLFQAETEADMMEWIATFQAAKDDLLSGRQTVERIPSNRKDAPPIEQQSPEDNVSRKAAFLREWDNDLRRHFKSLGSEECALCSKKQRPQSESCILTPIQSHYHYYYHYYHCYCHY
jgi:hypothetical protein